MRKKIKNPLFEGVLIIYFPFFYYNEDNNYSRTVKNKVTELFITKYYVFKILVKCIQLLSLFYKIGHTIDTNHFFPKIFNLVHFTTENTTRNIFF